MYFILFMYKWSTVTESLTHPYNQSHRPSQTWCTVGVAFQWKCSLNLEKRLILWRVRNVARNDYYPLHIYPYSWDNSAPTGRIFIKLYIREFSKICGGISIWIKINGTWNEDKCKFLIMPREFLLEWEMFQTKILKEIKIYFMFNIPPQNSVFYEIMWKITKCFDTFPLQQWLSGSAKM
jgi:hypothetical protein